MCRMLQAESSMDSFLIPAALPLGLGTRAKRKVPLGTGGRHDLQNCGGI